MPPSLNGRVVAFVEARMQSEMAALVERHGGVAYPAPVLQEVYLNDDPDVQRLIRDVWRRPHRRCGPSNRGRHPRPYRIGRTPWA